MSAGTREFGAVIESLAPLGLAAEWDNSGYNLRLHEHISRVLVCVDVTQEVVEEAVLRGCDTIVSHHPLIFHGLKCVEGVRDAHIAELIRCGINVYCAHTSFDCAPGGMNDGLAFLLGLLNVRRLTQEIGSVGELPQKMSARDFAEWVKQVCGAPVVLLSDTKKEIGRVAIVTGSGGEYLKEALFAGADMLLTGEARHSSFLEARALGIVLAAAGHYDTEHIFTEIMAKGLQNSLSGLQYNIDVYRSKTETRPYEAV